MVPNSHPLVLSGQVYLFPVVIIGRFLSFAVLDVAAHQHLLFDVMLSYSESFAVIAIAQPFQSPRRLSFISSCTRWCGKIILFSLQTALIGRGYDFRTLGFVSVS